MGRIKEFFGNPGSRPDVEQQAPITINTCANSEEAVKDKFDEDVVSLETDSESNTEGKLSKLHFNKRGDIETSRGFTGLWKGRTDNVLDVLVRIAGSQAVFFLMWAILITWVVIGIVYSAPFNWQVVMQDGQSIQSYLWDTLLMRQQLMSAHEQVHVCGTLRSRIAGYKRLFQQHAPEKDTEVKESHKSFEMESDQSTISGELPAESWYDKLSSCFSRLLGSLPVMIIFWLGIFVWIGCGAKPLPTGNSPPFTGETSGSNPRLAKFSDDWQMYINTATAICLLVSTVFLQNIRARHDKYLVKFLHGIFSMDEKIDYQLRNYYNDFETPNPVITIYSKKRSSGEELIDWYADVIGTGIGVVVAVVVFAVWLGIGTPMGWSDDWWLIIGTYTGLIGFLDGFVIRQVYFRIVGHEEINYKVVAQDDAEIFDMLGIHCPDEFSGLHIPKRKNSIDYKISSFINTICSSQWSVLVSVLTILGLIIIASGLRWSTTGQLICNTPTMIIEAFFMIVLLQAHNWADQQRRIEVTALFMRRRYLLAYVEEVYEKNGNSDVVKS